MMDMGISNCWSSDFDALAKDLALRETILIANRDINKMPHLHGEDFFIYRLLAKLKDDRISIDVAMLLQNTVKLFGQNDTRNVQSLDNILKTYDTIILFNVSPSRVMKAKFKRGLKIIMPIIYLWNNSSSAISNLRNLVGNTLWQIVVNEYIATSNEIAQGLKRRGILRRVYLIPPVYKCEYCSPVGNTRKLSRLKERLPPKVKAVYIGSVDSTRFSLADVISNFSHDQQRAYELDIYTATPVKEKAGKIGRVTVNIFRKILSDEEKCKVLSESHLLIAPKCGTTMDPSITVMEAEYHGNIVTRI